MIREGLCRALGHKIDRKRVWHHSYDYRTECQRCHAPLVRLAHGWEIFDAATDDAADRLPHPRDRMN